MTAETAFKKIIFIDRDGVINVDPIGDYIKSWADFRFEEGALETLKALTDRNYGIILISNQAGIGDGIYPKSALDEIHTNMLAEFAKHGIRIRSSHFCLHGKNEGCKCRKPELGLFREAVKGLNYDPKTTFFIGDKATDVQAGKRFGLRTIMLRTGHGKNDEAKLTGAEKPDYIFNRFIEVLEVLP